MSLISVGTVAFDSVETKYGKKERIVGGASMYTSLAASYFTKSIKMVSVIGEDFPATEIEYFKTRGIDTTGLEVVKGGKSFFWEGKYRDDMNGRDTLVTELNVLADFNPVLPQSYKDAPYVMLGNLAPAVQISVLEQMNSRPKLVALDTMNFWMDNSWDDLMKVLTKIDMLIINDEEARQLSDCFNMVEAAQKILTMGPKILIIKKGEHGSILFHEEGFFAAPAMPLLVIKDPTGAGDCFAGGIMGYLTESDDLSFENLKRSLVMGTIIASFCVEDFGNERIKNISEEDLQTRIHNYRKFTQFELA